MRIPFSHASIAGKELYYMAKSVLTGHIAGNGPSTKKCQALIEEKFKFAKILLAHSCSAMREMTAMLRRSGLAVISKEHHTKDF